MKKNIAVIAGGNSLEHNISLKSAETVAQSLDKDKFNVFKIIIKGKSWFIDTTTKPEINKNNFSFSKAGEIISFDCVFSAIHGNPGENGKLQSYFEMLKIPYVGCNSLSSSLSFNKFHCNVFLKNFEINVANSVLLNNNLPYNKMEILLNIGLPCFVKPNAGGSSLGITKVKTAEEFEPAIGVAYKESDEVIVEQFIKGKEITCGIYKLAGKFVVLPLAEIISKNEFFDYQAKYNDAITQEIVPAKITPKLTENCAELSKTIYNALNCKGLIRVDYILKQDKFYLLEVNTIPGMTSESLVPKMIKEAGKTFGEIGEAFIYEVLK